MNQAARWDPAALGAPESPFRVMDRRNVDYMKPILFDDNGRLKVLPAEVYKQFPHEDIVQFSHDHGIYGYPTTELVEFIAEELGASRRNTIEIGAGNGVLSDALAITGTDSMMQSEPGVAAYYNLFGQPQVTYGPNVKRYDGNTAVDLYKPSAVVAQWVTHLYNPLEHWREGNMYGVDEAKILKKVRKYIFIGNDAPHSRKPILSLPHREIRADWIVSRAFDPALNVIWIWEKSRD